MSAGTWEDTPVKAGGGDYEVGEVPPDGAIGARLCAIIDVGTHDRRDMKGNVSAVRCVVLGYELAEQDSRGKPFYMVKLERLSMDIKANLYKVVKALHGEPQLGDRFSPLWIANKPCLLQISHTTKSKNGKERTYANLDSVGKPPRGMATPQGGCIIWRVGSPEPLGDVSMFPAMWNENEGKMLTIAEWVNASAEMRKANKVVMAVPNGKATAEPMTQAEADAHAKEDIQF